MGAVAGEALQAAPFGGDAGVGRVLPEDRLDLLRAFLIHLGRSLDELGVGESDRRGVRDRQRLGMQADEMRFVAGGERAGAIAYALGVLRTLDDGKDGLERHGFLPTERRSAATTCELYWFSTAAQAACSRRPTARHK